MAGIGTMWICAVSSYNLLFCTIRDCLGLVFVYLFHLMMGSCYIYPTLSLSGLKNTHFTKGSSTHMVFASPSLSICLYQGPVAGQKLFQKESSYPQRVTGLCTKILKARTVRCDSPVEACQRHQRIPIWH